jgi:large conductance mechanosensitive channel
MLKEFKEFALRGNVIDLAIGIIIGGAFGAIVSSLVNDVIMPPIGLILARVNFADLFVALDGKQYVSLEAAKAVGAPIIKYGMFLNTLINFVIIAFVIFLVVRQINKLAKPKEAPAVPTTKDCPFCFSAIPVKAIKCPQCTSQLTPPNP